MKDFLQIIKLMGLCASLIATSSCRVKLAKLSTPTEETASTAHLNPSVLAISPSTKVLSTRSSFGFSSSGGTSPYQYSVTSGEGTVLPDSGLYTASLSQGTAVIRVTDSQGQVSDARVTINPVVLEAPTYVSSHPASPSSSISPLIKGSSSGDTATIHLYKDSGCTLQIGSGTKALWEGTGIETAITANGSTPIYVQALDAAGNLSDCVQVLAAYISDSLAPTNPGFTAPTGGVTQATTGYTFQWSSTDSGSGISSYTYSFYNTSNCTGGVVVSGTASSGSYVGTLAHLSNSLSVTAYDGAGNASSAVCSSHVKYNRDPVATNDTLIVAKNAAATPISVLANDTDADGDTLSIANISQPTNGTTAISGNNVNYTPNSNYYGLDTFTYTIQDTSGGSTTGTVIVKVMTPFTWTGATGDGKWSTGGNWCGTVTAGACPGGAAPSSTTTTTHIAVFNSTCTYCNAGIDVNASAYKIELNSSYAGTLTQNSTRTISIGTGGYSQAAGTFTGGDANITFAGAAPFTLSGGTYSATSATTNFSNNTTVTYSTGTFNHNNGTWRFDTVQVGFNASRTYTFSLTPASMTFYNLTTGGNSNYEWSNYSLSVPSGKSLIVENNFTIARTGGYGNACLIGGGTIDLRGNLLSPSGACHNGNSSPNNGKILFSGIANQTYQYNAVSCSSVSGSGSSTCTLPTFEINKPSGTVSAAGGTTQLAVQNFILTSGTFTAPTGTMRTRTHFIHTGGAFDANSGTFAYDPIQTGYNSNLTMNFSISVPSFNFSNLQVLGSSNYEISTYTLSIPAGKTIIANNVTIQRSGSYGNTVVNGSTLEIQGNLTVGAGANGGTTRINFTGGNAQIATRTAGTAPTGAVTVNKSAGTFSLASNFLWNSTGQDVTIAMGELDLAGFTLTVNDVLTIDPGGILRCSGGIHTQASFVNNGTEICL